MDKKQARTLKQKVIMMFRLLKDDKKLHKRNFFRYHLIRRKYIISRSSEFFDKNKFEPAPLLGKKVLDVGCGLNGISDELSFRGADILAIDTRDSIIKAAQENALHNGSPVEYKHISLMALEEDNKFDIILALDFLNNRNIDKYLNKINNLLAEDGLLIISGSNKTIKSYIRNIYTPKFVLKILNLNINSKYLIKLKKVKNKLNDLGFNILGVQGIDFNFFSGKWHKTKSTRVRYMMYASKIKKDM